MDIAAPQADALGSPIPGCPCRTWKLRRHVTETHLHPLFMREVLCTPDITRARKAVVDRLRLRLLGPGKSLLELSVEVLSREVLNSPAPIPEDIREAMHACMEAGNGPPNFYCLDGDLH